MKKHLNFSKLSNKQARNINLKIIYVLNKVSLVLFIVSLLILLKKLIYKTLLVIIF